MRHALSDNHFSTDQQLSDVIDSLSDNDRAAFLEHYPEPLKWDGSWLDTDAMGVDVEWSSWAIDWIERNTSVMWEDGEPWLYDGVHTDL